MAGELEDAKHSEDAQRHEGATHVLVVGHHQADVVRQDGHHVDDAHHGTHETVTTGCSKQTHKVFHCEYHDAGSVDAEERHCVAFAARLVFLVGSGTTGNGLYDISDDRDGNEETSDIVEDQGQGGCVRVLEGAPHGLSEVQVGLLQVLVLLLVILQPLQVFPLSILVLFVAAIANDLGHDAEERQLLIVG